jgi:hypothetical protein
MWYEMRDDEMSWKQGVWFRRTGIVPYNRITNLDVIQGTVMRIRGISSSPSRPQDILGRRFPGYGLKGLNMQKICVN